MRQRAWIPVSSAVLVAATIGVMENTARAANCSTLPGPVLVIESGDTQEPLLKALGRQLRNSATPMTILYKTTGTCTLTADLYNGTKIAQNSNLSYVPSTTEDAPWNTTVPSPTCTVDTVGGLSIDLGIGATFLTSCTQAPPKPASIGLFTGPVQGYGFIVPKASSQRAVTAEEGYFAWGFGATGQAEPWVDPQFFYGRTATKSTALTLAASIGLNVTQLKGILLDKSTEVLNLVATSANPEKTIGMLGTEVFDANRGEVTLLAFRAFKQRYAYYPDSTPTSFDKKNLRDGHYIPWAPTIYVATVDGNGAPTNAQAKTFMDLVFGMTSFPDVDGLGTAIAKGLIPDCAMQVTRSFDGDELRPYAPAEPCGCYYESKVPGGATKCTACTDDAPCNGGKCRRGFCEAR